MFGFMVWSSVFAVPPLLLLSLAFDGAGTDWHAIAGAHADAWAALAWQVVGNSLFGYVAWNWLLTRYDAATVTPYALLVPVFGMGASAVLLGEPLRSINGNRAAAQKPKILPHTSSVLTS